MDTRYFDNATVWIPVAHLKTIKVTMLRNPQIIQSGVVKIAVERFIASGELDCLMNKKLKTPA